MGDMKAAPRPGEIISPVGEMKIFERMGQPTYAKKHKLK